MPTNTAAWLRAKGAKLEVGPAPYTRPRANEIVIKNHAVAINPVDWAIQAAKLFPWIKFPTILGSDAAGVVVEVGPGVTRFAVGDRVLGLAVGLDKKRNTSAEAAFQDYTVLLTHMAAPIPNTMSYESAAVLPLGVSTAASGLFQKDQLALHLPSADAKPTGETLLVWGGSTSVGSNAIQLAVAAGYEVITTCSPQNYNYVKRLGAAQAFDYASPTVVADIIRAFEGKPGAGALALGVGSAHACAAVVTAIDGRKFISTGSVDGTIENGLTPGTIAKIVFSNISLWFKTRPRHIHTKMIFGSSLMYNKVGPAIYVSFLPQALMDGRYAACPEPYVVGTGLNSVQTGLDIQKKGVSAKKVVVSL